MSNRSASNPLAITPYAEHFGEPRARGRPRVLEEAVGLRARSLEIRTACAASVNAVTTAVGELKNTLRRTSTSEAEDLTSAMLRAPNLAFRRVLPASLEAEGGPRNVFCGAAVEMIAGRDPGVVRLSREAWYARVHPDDLPAYRVAEAQRRRSGKPYTMEYRIRHALSGETRWVRETAWAERDADLGRTVLDSHILDVTEDKRAELELRASEGRYRRLVEERDTYICCFGPDHRLTFVNDAFCRRFSHARADLVGIDVQSLLAGAMADAWAAHLASPSRAEPAITHELALDAPDGTRRFEEWTVRATFDAAGGLVEYQAFGRDVSERKSAEQRVLHLAYHDPLTDLPNRLLFEDRLRQALARATRDHNRVALLMVDLDDFKRVNDTFGQPAGDRVLCEVGDRLRGLVRDTDTVARLGGDEFVVLLTALCDHDGAEAVAGKISAALSESFAVHHQTIRMGASLGIAVFPDDTTEPETLLGHADVALYRAKQAGGGRFSMFRSTAAPATPGRAGLERELASAVPREQLFLLYQPRFELRDRYCTGFEALVRWRHPRHGTMLPEHFVPAAEAGRLIDILGAWVLEEACRRSALWRAAGAAHTIAVNLSPRQIVDQDLLELVGGVLERTGTAPQCLELEITESMLVDLCDPEVIAKLRAVSELGVRLAVDDFGRGCSSLAYLSRLPIDGIKIDQTFVRNVGRDRADEAIIKAVVGLGHSLGRRVVAEGVETEEQLAFVRDQGCDEAQGFYLGPPLLPAKAGGYLGR